MARREQDGRPAVVLDRSAFYAESGGQPWDTGTLGEARVVAVVEESGELLHVLDRPLAEGPVQGRVDADPPPRPPPAAPRAAPPVPGVRRDRGRPDRRLPPRLRGDDHRPRPRGERRADPGRRDPGERGRLGGAAGDREDGLRRRGTEPRSESPRRGGDQRPPRRGGGLRPPAVRRDAPPEHRRGRSRPGHRLREVQGGHEDLVRVRAPRPGRGRSPGTCSRPSRLGPVGPPRGAPRGRGEDDETTSTRASAAAAAFSSVPSTARLVASSTSRAAPGRQRHPFQASPL